MTTKVSAGVLSNTAVFASGTRITFHQSTSPVGWVQDTTDVGNNRMLRVVSGSGGSVGGSHDPTTMSVVPYHTHGFSTGNQSGDHAHYTSGQTGGQSANHYHNLNTDQGSAFYGQSAGGGSAQAGYTGGYAVELIQPYTQYTSNDHSHAWGNWSGGVNANHTHSGGTDGGSSQTNWTPRYIDLIVCQKN